MNKSVRILICAVAAAAAFWGWFWVFPRHRDLHGIYDNFLAGVGAFLLLWRSEERRVGKECRL